MYQQTTVVGHLGRDPEMRYTPSGAAVTSFSVATTRKWTDASGAAQEKTTWFRVSAWGKQAEACNTYLRKGSLVCVVGDIEAHAYANQQGEPAASLELRASTVRFLSKRDDGEQAAPEPEDTVPF